MAVWVYENITINITYERMRNVYVMDYVIYMLTSNVYEPNIRKPINNNHCQKTDIMIVKGTYKPVKRRGDQGQTMQSLVSLSFCTVRSSHGSVIQLD